MIRFDDIRELYLVSGATDLRKGIDGYAALIVSKLQRSPTDHSLYIFCNGNRDKLKCLYYDGTGFWLLYKRMDKGHFKWIRSEQNGSVQITHQQLNWLLEGLKIEQKTAFRKEEKSFI